MVGALCEWPAEPGFCIACTGSVANVKGNLKDILPASTEGFHKRLPLLPPRVVPSSPARGLEAGLDEVGCFPGGIFSSARVISLARGAGAMGLCPGDEIRIRAGQRC
jgi:hypothetical protein